MTEWFGSSAIDPEDMGPLATVPSAYEHYQVYPLGHRRRMPELERWWAHDRYRESREQGLLADLREAGKAGAVRTSKEPLRIREADPKAICNSAFGIEGWISDELVGIGQKRAAARKRREEERRREEEYLRERREYFEEERRLLRVLEVKDGVREPDGTILGMRDTEFQLYQGRADYWNSHPGSLPAGRGDSVAGD